MANISRRGFVHAAGAVALTPTVSPRAQTEADIRTERDIVFGRGGNMDLMLDVYHPPSGPEKRSATIHVHGGGFSRGSKESVSRAAPFYARLGHVAIASQYRLSGQGAWPDQLHDVKAAIRWTRANADRLDIDPNRISVAGYSAGGLMALFAAATQDHPMFEGSSGSPGVSTRLNACIAYYPATSTPMSLLPEGIDDTALREAQLDSWLGAHCAPTVLFQGTADSVVPLPETERLGRRLTEDAVPVELHTFEGQPHLFDRDPSFGEVCARLADLFLDRRV